MVLEVFLMDIYLFFFPTTVSLSPFFFYSVGCIFCGPKEPIRACTRFRARILIFNIEIPITKGFPVSSKIFVTVFINSKSLYPKKGIIFFTNDDAIVIFR